MEPDSLGSRVRARRDELNLTQQDLAKRVGVSQVAIKKIESGGQTRHGRKLAEALGTTLEWLETGQGQHGTVEQPVSDARSWPFPGLTEDLFDALGRDQIARVEGAILLALGQMGIDVKKPPARRPAATSATATAPQTDVDMPFPMRPLAAVPTGSEELPFPEAPKPAMPWDPQGWRTPTPPRPAMISRSRDVVTNVVPGDHAANDDFEPVPELPEVRLAAGDEGIEIHNEAATGVLQFRRSFLRQHDADGGRARVVYASGESMEPVIPNGAAMLFVPADGLSLRDVAGGGVWAINYDGKMLVKTIVRNGMKQWVARSFNQAFPDILLDGDVDVRVLGRIVWVGAELPPEVRGQWLKG